MAQLALAAAGAAVGSFFGPIGTSIGWSLGAMIGASFGPKITNDRGPVSDLRYTDSSYGAPLALHYGTVPVSRAQVIWTPDNFRAVRNVESSGGKGGPRVEDVTYTYETDIAIALSGRQCAGLGRVWVDNILRSNFRSDATVDETLASAQWFDNLVFYSGAEDQEPDATMEAALGVGEVPAYRGTCYVVITGIRCGAQPRLPNLVFEVIADGTAAAAGLIVTTAIAGTGSFYNTTSNQHVGMPTLRFENGSLVWQRDGDTVAVVVEADGTEQVNAPTATLQAFASGNPYAILVGPSEYHISWGTALLQFTPSGTAFYFGVNVDDGAMLFRQAGVPVVPDLPDFSTADNEIAVFARPGKSPIAAAGCSDRHYCLVWYTAQDWAIWRLEPVVEVVREGTADIGTDNWYTPFGICYAGDGGAYTWAAACMESNLQHVWIVGANETYGKPGEVFCYEIGADDVMRRVYYYYEAGDPGGQESVCCYADDGLLHLMYSTTPYHLSGGYRVHSRLQAASGTVQLGTVVSDLYSRTGYDDAADLDVAALTQTVDGYEFAVPRPVRAGIEELRAAYLFDLVETDGVIKGVNRGGAASSALVADDLGMADDGGLAALLETTRETESEVPFEVLVKYMSKDGAYRAGAQRAENAATSSNEQLTIDLPLVLTDDRAAELADILRRDRWRSRTTHRLVTSRKHLAVDPADVVTVDDGEAVRTLRVTAQKISGGRLEMDLVAEGAADYTSGAVGGGVSVPYQPLRPAAHTNYSLIDAPLFYPLQDDYGLLLAARGYQTSWAGATLFQSSDGSSYAAMDSTTLEAVLGYATNALAAPVTTAVIPDETSSLSVNIPSTLTLASTDMDGLLELEQVAAVASGSGWEIIAWRDATDDGDGNWTLSGLLRGLAGTESYASGHAVGDRFVVLDDAALTWVEHGAGDVGQLRYYKVPAFGQALTQVTAQSLTFAAATLKPLPPVHIAASRATAAGNITIQWQRRGRVDHVMRDYWADATLDEPSESYEVDILNAAGTAVLRTLAATTGSVSYTTTQQAADFGAAGNVTALNLRVYQLSSRVGRGFAAAANVNVSLNVLWLRDWNDTLLTNQTTFVESGGSINTYSAATGDLRIASSNNRVMWVRMDAAPQIADGFLQAEVALESATTQAYVILVYRTATAAFGNSQGCFAYRVAMHSNNVYLERGQNNSAGGTVTTIASASVTTTANVTGTLRVRFSGSSHRVWFNDVPLIDTTDATYASAGAMGVGAQSAGAIVISRLNNLTVFTN